MPKRALYDFELEKYASKLKIPHFRGVFMRDNLPTTINSMETGIINLDSKHNLGTHWTCYIKQNHKVIYFDSFGNLKPPIEVVNYFQSLDKNITIFYHRQQVQTFNTSECGQLCLKFLSQYKPKT